MQSMISRNLAALAVAVMLPLAACDDSVSGGEGTGRMTIHLTDAPGDSLSAAVVTISKIYLAGGGSDSTDERVVLREEAVTTNLLTLQNDIKTLISDKAVPAGSYGQLRFVIDGAYIAVKSGTSTRIFATSNDYEGLPAGTQVDGELKCPSCAQSGFKVVFGGGFQVEEGEETDLLVDFDVGQSFGHEAGASGKWVLRPTLKATSVSSAASIRTRVSLNSGLTLPAIGGQATTLGLFKAKLTNAAGSAEEQVLTDANSDGVFEANFRYLIPSGGPYTVTLVGPAGLTFTTDPATVAPIAVTGGSTSVDFKLMTAVAAGT